MLGNGLIYVCDDVCMGGTPSGDPFLTQARRVDQSSACWDTNAHLVAETVDGRRDDRRVFGMLVPVPSPIALSGDTNELGSHRMARSAGLAFTAVSLPE